MGDAMKRTIDDPPAAEKILIPHKNKTLRNAKVPMCDGEPFPVGVFP